MLNLKKVLGAKPKEHVEVHMKPLLTPWGESLDVAHVLEEHPDPQFARTSFAMLNGVWEYAIVKSGHKPEGDLLHVVAHACPPRAFEGPIVVPFSPEAPLSGVGRKLAPDELLWYRRTFRVPALGNRTRCLLHFQAVDYACACYVNGQLAGTHAGGYTPFYFDVTDLLVAGAHSEETAAQTAEIMVCVADPSEAGGHLRGKQRLDRGDIWYTAQSGIWQPVWLEAVPADRIERISIEADPTTGILAVGVHVVSGRSEPCQLHLDVFDADDNCVAAGSAPVQAGQATGALAVHVPDARPWSPDDPYLYALRVSFGEDEVASYCGFRSVEVRDDAGGVKRVFLNGSPLFIKGVLDQAYWPDGLMTAPADEAFAFDIQAMKADGFNLMRKHIKIESPRFYYHCDRLGMLVLQDMVSGGAPEIRLWDWSYKPTLVKASWSRFGDRTVAHQRRLGAGGAAYRREWTDTCLQMIRLLGNHPCILGWSLFNEGWGQFDARGACKLVRKADPTRFIDATSGWYDQRCGDFFSVHNYFRPLEVWPDRRARRAFLISEFGGFAYLVAGHSALDQAYGYEVYETLPEWQAATRTLLRQADALEQQGLAGYIYTQVSDIEEEVNGILTYDRRVNKLSTA